MPRIGTWWFKSVEAEPDEQVVWSQLANRVQSRRRAIGGKLFLTDRRLVFCPHLIDAATGGKNWALPLADVTGIGITPKGGDTFAGGMRDRLRIEFGDDEQQLFVIKRLDEVVPRLEAAVGADGHPTPGGAPAT